MSDNKKEFVVSGVRAIIKKDGKWWIGWIEEMPGINCQEKTKKELLETLKISLAEMINMNKRRCDERSR
jgi:predicted RNase H-like HicB family nuclease